MPWCGYLIYRKDQLAERRKDWITKEYRELKRVENYKLWFAQQSGSWLKFYWKWLMPNMFFVNFLANSTDERKKCLFWDKKKKPQTSFQIASPNNTQKGNNSLSQLMCGSLPTTTELSELFLCERLFLANTAR